MEKQARFEGLGIRAFQFDRDRPLADPTAALAGVTDLLVSVPPDAAGDPVLDQHGNDIAAATGLRWLGYLSTTGVYGDTGGAPVDETSRVNPSGERGRRRVQAEQRWLNLNTHYEVPVHVFRLAGIYGPGRSILDQVRAGRARRIDKPGHLFSRIHVADISTVLRASMVRPVPGAIYNVADDRPAPPSDVVAHACELLGVEAPAPIHLDVARAEMSEMALSFWRDNRRVVNRRIKDELGVNLKFPDYETGLQAIHDAEQRM